jgi:hypothetical protein
MIIYDERVGMVADQKINCLADMREGNENVVFCKRGKWDKIKGRWSVPKRIIRKAKKIYYDCWKKWKKDSDRITSEFSKNQSKE